MFSKREREGYVLIDHTDSPGIDHASGLLGGGKRFEAATNTCSHCQAVVVMNPDRLRQRGHCYNCDHYICDGCAVAMTQTGFCASFDRFADEYLERQLKISAI